MGSNKQYLFTTGPDGASDSPTAFNRTPSSQIVKLGSTVRLKLVTVTEIVSEIALHDPSAFFTVTL